MADILPFRRKDTPAPPDRTHDRKSESTPLWREALGRSLRTTREEQRERLADVAERAGISTQYLSEIERGRKEPSSEMIAAVAGAMGLDLADLLIDVAGGIRHTRQTGPTGPVLLAA